VDKLPIFTQDKITQIREYFVGCKWYEVYDLIEYCAERASGLTQDVNRVLEQELSAYRLVSGKIAPIASELENRTIEGAIVQTAQPYPTASHHLQITGTRLKNPLAQSKPFAL
jgi:hypothetical protein